MPSFGVVPAATGPIEQLNSADQAPAVGAMKCSGGAGAGSGHREVPLADGYTPAACLATLDWAQVGAGAHSL